MAKGLQPEIKQEFRLIFFRRNQPNNLLAQTLINFFGLDLGDKAVFIRLAHKITRGGAGHNGQPAVA